MGLQIDRVSGNDQINEGDILALEVKRPDEQFPQVITTSAAVVKKTEIDGEEVIFDLKKNLYFNVCMMLEGGSWIRSAYIIRVN